MASLAELYGQAATSYGKARAKARQIPANLRESGKGLASWAVDPYNEAQRVMGEYRNMTPEQRQGLVDAAVDLFGGVDVGPVGAIKASHGSPHLFDRFDFSKIGTGEGAQAYGHGGYFAQGFDSPVAKEYRDALAGVEVGGKLMIPGWDSPYYYPLEALRKHGDDIEKARADVYERNKNIPGGWPEELVAFEDAVKQGIKRNQGNLYNVELKWPDAAKEATDPLGEHHLLDWDAPMKEQPSEILKALKKSDFYKGAKEKYKTTKEWYHNPDTKTGESFYKYIQSGLSDDVREGGMSPIEASEYFRSLGIPGIRYLDQASRDQGKGTRNYVMFDDRFPNIVTRNGVSITDLLKNR